MDFFKTFKTIAPGIATMLGGPLGGFAAREAIKALDPNKKIKDDATEEELLPILEKLVAGATPEKLKRLEIAHDNVKAEMKKHGIEEAKVHAGDRANARQREIDTKDDFQKYLAAFVVVSFIAEIFFIIWLDRKIDGLVASLIGVHGSASLAIITYYFGSSKSSSDKTKMLGAM